MVPVVLGVVAAPEGITLIAAQVRPRDDRGVLIIIFRIECIAAAPFADYWLRTARGGRQSSTAYNSPSVLVCSAPPTMLAALTTNCIPVVLLLLTHVGGARLAHG